MLSEKSGVFMLLIKIKLLIGEFLGKYFTAGLSKNYFYQFVFVENRLKREFPIKIIT
jgi:hypothetical protein